MLGWHLLNDDWRTEHGSRKRKPWKVGEKRYSKGIPDPCVHGYHFCPTIVDVIEYGYGDVLCRIEAPDNSIQHHNKYVGHCRKIIAGANCDDIFNEFALVATRRILKKEGLNDTAIDRLLDVNALRSWENVFHALDDIKCDAVLTSTICYVRYQDGLLAARSAMSKARDYSMVAWAEEWLEEKVNARLACS